MRPGDSALDFTWAKRVHRKNARKIRLLSAYPSFRVIDSASPPVSPSVVARILTTQNANVTRGTLLRASPSSATA
jgi:hypothetical protein